MWTKHLKKKLQERFTNLEWRVFKADGGTKVRFVPKNDLVYRAEFHRSLREYIDTVEREFVAEHGDRV